MNHAQLLHIDYNDNKIDKVYCPFLEAAEAGVVENPQGRRTRNILKNLLLTIWSRRIRRRDVRIPEQVSCVLVAIAGNLGGAVISLPLVKGLKTRWPQARLVLVGNRQHGLDIAKRAGLGDDFICAPSITFKEALTGNPEARKFRRQIAALRPDVFVGNFDFHYDYLIPLHKIPYILTQGSVQSRGYYRTVYDSYVPYDWGSENWLGAYWKVLKLCGVDNESYPEISADFHKGHTLIEKRTGVQISNETSLIGIQASVWEQQLYKAWPIEKMEALCQRLIKGNRTKVLVIGSPGQDLLIRRLRNLGLSEDIALDGVGKFSIEELPDAVAACAVVVTNDSGLMHVSAATGTPTLAIYGMTDPAVTWVYGADTRHAIVRKAGCMPCYHRVSDVDLYCKEKGCIRQISVGYVYERLLELIQEKAV